MSPIKSPRARRSTSLSVAASNEEEWEDESDTFSELDFDDSSLQSITNTRSDAAAISRPTSTSVRKRKVLTGSLASPKKVRSPAKLRIEQRPARAARPDPIPSRMKEGAANGASFVLWYTFDVLFRVIWLLKFPLTLFLFSYVLIWMLGWMGNAILPAFQALCLIPGSSYLLPICATSRHTAPQAADFPALVAVQSTTFERMLDESVGGSTLSLEIKKSEIATKDLITLVKVSELKTRDSVAESLYSFVADARSTSEGLQKLSSRVKYAVDGVVAINNHALASIDAARKDQLMVPWYAIWKPSAEVVVLTKFTESMDYLSDAIERLILEGQVQMKNLADLEAHLDLIAELVSREDFAISAQKDEVLSSLWTVLGGNKSTLRRYNNGLTLLKAITTYRKAALLHVVSAMHTLQEMKSDLEVIRERVGAPGLVGSSIPVEVHMSSIQSGLLRLKESNMRAKERERKALDNLVSA